MFFPISFTGFLHLYNFVYLFIVWFMINMVEKLCTKQIVYHNLYHRVRNILKMYLVYKKYLLYIGTLPKIYKFSR